MNKFREKHVEYFKNNVKTCRRNCVTHFDAARGLDGAGYRNVEAHLQWWLRFSITYI